MASEKTVRAEIRKAIKERKTETGEANAVARTLALHGHTAKPVVHMGRSPDGATVRVYVYENTPAGDFLLVSGPSIEGEIQTMNGPAAKQLAEAGLYIQGRKATSKTSQRILAGMGRAAGKTQGRKTTRKTKTTRKKTTTRKKAKTPEAPRGMDYTVGRPTATGSRHTRPEQQWPAKGVYPSSAPTPPAAAGGNVDAAALAAMFKTALTDVVGGL